MAYHDHQEKERFLIHIFRCVDEDGSGLITSKELQMALSNAVWKPFNAETVRMMIGMFDRDNSGTINFEEFKSLWSFITQWLRCFESFDTDKSGNIDKNELKNALTTFGYRLSDGFYDTLVKKFSRDETPTMKFDDFIQCCVQLQTLTAAFKYHDTDMDGWIKISYEEFLKLAISLRM